MPPPLYTTLGTALYTYLDPDGVVLVRPVQLGLAHDRHLQTAKNNNPGGSAAMSFFFFFCEMSHIGLDFSLEGRELFVVAVAKAKRE